MHNSLEYGAFNHRNCNLPGPENSLDLTYFNLHVGKYRYICLCVIDYDLNYVSKYLSNRVLMLLLCYNTSVDIVVDEGSSNKDTDNTITLGHS